jgi:DMSO/TMAO reductase YedYZ molybdopterin-dependent catalytic subunit
MLMTRILAANAKPVTSLVRILDVTDEPRQPGQSRRYSVRRALGGRVSGLGAILGVVTALVALGVAQMVAALISSPVGQPVTAVGEVSIRYAPSAIHNFAIREFGTHDKAFLVWGIRIVLIIFAAAIGVLAIRKLWHGLIGLAVFIAIGILAAESQPTATVGDAFPTVVGGLIAALFLWKASALAREGAGLARLDWPPARPVPGPEQVTPPPRPATTEREPEGAGPPDTPADTEQPDGEPAEVWQRWLPPLPAEPEQPGQPAAGDQPDRHEAPGRREPAASATAGASRRRFLYVSAGAAGAGLLAYGGGTLLGERRDVTAAQQALRFPKAAVQAPPLPAGYDLKIPGLSSFITPNSSFYRVDTAIVLPEVLPQSWQLRIHGMVQRELVLNFRDILKRPLIEDYITLCCVSNPVSGPYVGNAKWLGASLRSLLQEAGVKAGATQLLCTSVDGFTSGTPVQTAMDGRDALLAVAMNGTALPVAHGFPARLVIPGLYGYVSACKWITDINVTTYGDAVSYWAQEGWAAQAPIKTESRIDVPALGATIKSGHRTAIAGVAWAQHKGIEAVEVRIGNGPWQEAQLAAVPDIDCWRQWVYYWDANVPPGSYLIEARATDKTGYTQTAVQVPPEPNGASGYPQNLVSVVS